MAKFEIDEFEERLTDNCVQQIEINTKKDTACLCTSLIWTLYFNFFQGCGAYKLVVMYLKNVMGMLIWLYELFLCSSFICFNEFLCIITVLMILSSLAKHGKEGVFYGKSLSESKKYTYF